MALSDLMDGWAHQLMPGEDFLAEQPLDVLKMEEADEDGLDPYESGSPVVEYGEVTIQGADIWQPFGLEIMIWSGVSLALQDLAEVVGGRHDAHHRNTYGEDGSLDQPQYWWRFVAGAEGFQGEGARL